MCKINYMLYKHISDNYKSVPAFADISGIPARELNAVLLKESVALDIASGIKLCRFLNLDIDKLVSRGEFAEPGGSLEPASGEFRRHFMRLSAIEKQKVIDFMDSV